MKLSLPAACALLLALSSPAFALPADDAVAAARTWLDRFNAGDMAAFYAGQVASPVIVDEFAPFVWTGAESAQRWAKDFDADSKAQGITAPQMDYAAPIRADSNGQSAYILLPTVYRFKQKGRQMSAAGSMTFVMVHQAAGWKIASWTYSAVAPAPDR